MKIVRLVGLGCGVMVLIAAGAATLTRGQQPTRAAVPAQASRSSTGGDDLVALEAELELLEMRHEADREELRDLIRKCNRLEQLRDLDIMTDVGLTLLFQEEFLGKDSADKSREGMGRALALADEKQSREIEDGAGRDVKKMFRSLQMVREGREARFEARTKELNARKQALAEARKKFRPEGR